LLAQLPQGGGLVGRILDARPDLAPVLSAAHVITQPQADAVQLINGLVAGISTDMKPVGLGSLREYEFDAFKQRLPNMLTTTEGQQKAVAYLMNLNNRIQQESQWMQNYYKRQVPDEMSTKPGATRKAFNLDTEGGQGVFEKMDNELGPVVPIYTPDKGQPMTNRGQNAWIATLPPGKPYYKRGYAEDPNNPGKPLLDKNGNKQPSTSLEVTPWTQ
jgi:hypothetical protein